MTATTLIGPIGDHDNVEVAADGPLTITLRYAKPEPLEGAHSYPVPVFPRLSAVLTRSETGWIARAPEVDALGHGDTWQAAMDSLKDEVEQYLEYVRDDRPSLARAISHHSGFVGLLATPRELWFASVSVDAPSVE
ncbi:MAG: hypothetical protein H0X28_01855 [Solirubrobacterales bacterium]|nr:hypothetical protein [Solirubrobacterales bacterium]